MRNSVTRVGLLTLATLALSSTSALAYDGSGPSYYTYDGGLTLLGPDGPSGPSSGGGGSSSPSSFGLSFDGISQIDVRGLHGNRSEIPPDTMGAVGTTQFLETSNGAYAVYDKTTGVQTKLWADGTFWSQAGQLASDGPSHFSNGDSRVLFDRPSGRWVIESFAASLDTIQIAVSDTSDATGHWKSTTFKGFSDGVGSGIADYPTLAIDGSAIYIGTNDFTQTPAQCGGIQFCGTTLNVISRSDIFAAGGPGVASLKQFNTPYDGVTDNGFAIQGVNQVGGTDKGRVLASGLLNFGPVTYSITNPGQASATQTASVLVDTTPYDPNNPAAQPNGARTIDSSDDRFSGAVWEYGGKIYAVHTITATGASHTQLEWYVIDAATNAVVQKGTIGDSLHDYFQGALTVNSSGQVVISYNRSGFGTDGNVTVLAQAFNPIKGGGGAIVKIGSEIVLKVSPIDNYHNGSPQFSNPVGRQRWGDYAQVTVDPNNPQNFWIIGEYALGYLPSPTKSFSRWGTWIADINVANVPEPSTWAVMLIGLGLVGGTLRRRRLVAT